MPIIESLMADLVGRYGKKRGEDVYYAMEAEGKGPFGPKGKYRQLHESFARRHGVAPAPKAKKKPRRR